MEFARLARRAREFGYAAHLVAGGNFAAFNAEALLHDEPAFDSAAIGEGERLIRDLAANLDSLRTVRMNPPNRESAQLGPYIRQLAQVVAAVKSYKAGQSDPEVTERLTEWRANPLWTTCPECPTVHRTYRFQVEREP